MTIFLDVVLAVNVLWFGLGFRLFSLRPRQAIRLLVPDAAQRDERSRAALLAALPFLGGMNLAWAALSAAALADGRASWTIFLACAIAHGSQLAANVPVARRGEPWPVLRGPMRFIFVVDGACALANLIVLALVLYAPM